MISTYGSSQYQFGNFFGTCCGRVMARVLAAALLAGAGTGLAAAQTGFQRTLVVSPVPGDPHASGRQLTSTLRSIAPTPEDP